MNAAAQRHTMGHAAVYSRATATTLPCPVGTWSIAMNGFVTRKPGRPRRTSVST